MQLWGCYYVWSPAGDGLLPRGPAGQAIHRRAEQQPEGGQGDRGRGVRWCLGQGRTATHLKRRMMGTLPVWHPLLLYYSTDEPTKVGISGQFLEKILKGTAVMVHTICFVWISGKICWSRPFALRRV